MKSFYHYLASAIREEAATFITTEQDHLRVMFCALPMTMLDAVFDILIKEGPRLRLEREGHIKSIPLLLIKPDAIDPSHQNSSRCTSNHVVTVRTSTDSFLAMYEVNDPPLISTDTTVNKTGLEFYHHQDLKSWMQEPFVNKVIDDVLARFNLDNKDELFDEIINKALEEAWAQSGQSGDQSYVWFLLRRLYDSAKDEFNNNENFYAELGLPKLKKEERPDSKINDKIADYFDEYGFNNGVQLLKDEAESSKFEILKALDDFRHDIIAKYRTAQEFKSSPILNYGDLNKDRDNTWWNTLSQSVWKELLDPVDVVFPADSLNITCSNELYTPSVASHPLVVDATPSFKIEIDDDLIGQSIKIYRAIGRKAFELIDELVLNKSILEWVDDTTSVEHNDYLRYQFICSVLEKPITIKLIVLESYVAGVTLNCRSASKITQFKRKSSKAKNNKASSLFHYECDMTTNGTGTHTLDFYHGTLVKLPSWMVGQLQPDETDNSAPSIEKKIIATEDGANHAVSVIETSEQCYYEFQADLPSESVSIVFRINILSSDFVSTGVSSEFDKLVVQNCECSTKSASQVDIKQTMLTNFENWLLNSNDSYHPVILGPGFKENWRIPNWSKLPVISELAIFLDPRPHLGELVPPENYLKSRENIRELLKEQCKNEDNIESLSLGQMMLDPEFKKLIINYVSLYAEWISNDPVAVWSDIVTVHKAEPQGNCLETRPIAILLSPFHPVRLAWQCNAQEILQDAVKQGLFCPAAGIFEPSSFPDCLALPCRDANNHLQKIGYAAVKSNSAYWGVLWRADAIQELGGEDISEVFGLDLGLSLEGMVSGFNKQQVKKSLNEIRQLMPAKSMLRVSLHSDSKGYSSCNRGIEEWCLEHLGSERDEWSSAGSTALTVLDARPSEEQPEPASLASLTERSGTSVRWYSDIKLDSQVSRDLSIVDHLSTMHQQFTLNHINSAVDPSCVSRISIKKNALDHQSFISMSRQGKFINPVDSELLQDNLARALSILETSCSDAGLFDSIGFAPNLKTLEQSLNGTRYCAISSSAVDSSCFHKSGYDAYLWDYELPKYAPEIGLTSGFYLIAKQSDNMFTVMRNVITSFSGDSTIDDTQITTLLREISKRGIPTLKRLTSGGTASLGEVGMLIASRLLQSDFQDDLEGYGIIPTRYPDRINFVIPADVFHPRFDVLRSALDSESHERPDLLVISILFSKADGEHIKPERLKITPIEVKTRSGEMDDQKRSKALNQATLFSDFLERLINRAKKSRIWDIAFRDLIASWIDYGFRIYGETNLARNDLHWTEYHQDTLTRLMEGNLIVDIDPIGRLISIEKGGTNKVLSYGEACDQKDTIILGFSDASALLLGKSLSIIELVKQRIEDWGLLANIEEQKTSLQNTLPKSKNNITDTSTLVKGHESPALLIHKDENEPSGITGIRFDIGKAPDLLGDNIIEFYPGNTELNNINIGVVGDLGTGKTQLLKSLVYQMIKNPENNRGKSPKVLILDYKRDFTDINDSTCQFINKAGVKPVTPIKLPLNLFNTKDSKSPTAWLDRYSFFRDILRKIFGTKAPVQDEQLKQAVKASFQNKIGNDPTIYDVFEEYKSLVDGKVDSVYSIISDIVDYNIFEEDPSKIITFEQFFDGVVAIDLKVFPDNKLKNMIIVIFLNFYYEYMLNVEKKPYIGENPQLRFIDSYLLVDEAHNIMPYEFDVLSKLLLQGRAFGVGVILASQYFSHFKTQKEDYREPINSWFIHNVPGVTARDLDKIGLPSVSDKIIDRIAKLGKFQSLCKTYGCKGEFIDEIPFYRLD